MIGLLLEFNAFGDSSVYKCPTMQIIYCITTDLVFLAYIVQYTIHQWTQFLLALDKCSLILVHTYNRLHILQCFGPDTLEVPRRIVHKCTRWCTILLVKLVPPSLHKRLHPAGKLAVHQTRQTCDAVFYKVLQQPATRRPTNATYSLYQSHNQQLDLTHWRCWFL